MAATSVSYKCPNCGAPLSYLPGTDHVTCEYCDATFDTEVIEDMFQKAQERAADAEREQEETWATEAAGEGWSEEEAASLHAFHCSSCGAELVTDANTMATECCYCGNPTMLPARFDGALRPNEIIPFQKTKKDAVAALKAFYEGKWLLPASFKKGNRVEAVQAMYVPYWLFDAKIKAQASFRAKHIHEYDDGDENVKEISVYDCYREGKMTFVRVPVDGSVKMDDTFMESIEPFDYSQLETFTPAYLTGALADRYDVDADAAIPRADERITQSAADLLKDTVEDYDEVEIKGAPKIRKRKGDVSYVMAPVWILTTRYGDTPYTFLMNGQTGKMAGSLPYDNRKSYIIMAIATLISWPILYFLIDFVSEDDGIRFSLLVLFVAFVAALFCGYGVRKYFIDQMSNVHPAPDATEYLKKGSFRLLDEDDTYLYTRTFRTKKGSRRDDD
ncbi:MAG: hypothetical protein SPL39_02035 [Selenomonadaceae bacterium]|nr:hypothetical protein [Selenomonadaceae bacterium]